MKTVQKVLTGLKTAVDQIEKYRNKFSHIKESELLLRKKFIIDTQRNIMELFQNIDSTEVRKKIEDDTIARTKSIQSQHQHHHKQQQQQNNNNNNNNIISSYSNSHKYENEMRKNDDFIQSTRSQSRLLITQQDQHLDSLGSAAERLGQLAGGINEELKAQNMMLNKLDEDLDDSTEN